MQTKVITVRPNIMRSFEKKLKIKQEVLVHYCYSLEVYTYRYTQKLESHVMTGTAEYDADTAGILL